MGGSKGSSGGSSGKVEYPKYVSKQHEKWLQIIGGDDGDDNDFGWIGETTDLNPYERAYTYDPTSDLSGVMNRADRFMGMVDALGGEEAWRARVVAATDTYGLADGFNWNTKFTAAGTATGVNTSLNFRKMIGQWGQFQLIDEKIGFEDLYNRAVNVTGADEELNPTALIRAGGDVVGKSLDWTTIFRRTDRFMDLTGMDWDNLIEEVRELADSLLFSDEEIDRQLEEWPDLFDSATTRAAASILTDRQIEDLIPDWESLVARAAAQANDLVVSDEFIDDMIAKNAAGTAPELAKTIARYNSGMADMGAIFTSTYVMGRALIEERHIMDMDRFAAELRLDAHRNRVAFIQDAQRILQSILSEHLNAKFKSRDAKNQFTQETVKAAQGIIEVAANLKNQNRQAKATFMLEGMKAAAQIAREKVALQIQGAVEDRNTAAQKLEEQRRWTESISQIITARFGFLMSAAQEAGRILIASTEERDRLLGQMTAVEGARLEGLFRATAQMGQMQSWQTQFQASAAQDLTRYMLSEVDAERSAAVTLSEISRVRQAQMAQYLEEDLDLDVEGQLWRFRLVQDYLNGVFAAPGGGHVISRDKSRTKGSGLGMIGGVASGAISGGVMGGLPGAIVGGIGGLLGAM